MFYQWLGQKRDVAEVLSPFSLKNILSYFVPQRKSYLRKQGVSSSLPIGQKLM